MYTELQCLVDRKVGVTMRDSKESVKFMQVLDRTIFLRLKDFSKSRGVTVQELIRVLVIPEWMRQFEEESKRTATLRRHRRVRAVHSPATQIVKARTSSRRA